MRALLLLLLFAGCTSSAPVDPEPEAEVEVAPPPRVPVEIAVSRAQLAAVAERVGILRGECAAAREKGQTTVSIPRRLRARALRVWLATLAASESLDPVTGRNDVTLLREALDQIDDPAARLYATPPADVATALKRQERPKRIADREAQAITLFVGQRLLQQGHAQRALEIVQGFLRDRPSHPHPRPDLWRLWQDLRRQR